MVHGLISALLLVLCASQAVVQKEYVPQLGSKIPPYILKARTDSRRCLTDDAGHRDPCASVAIQKKRFTIAWDAKTNEVTYLFTDDPDLVMDSELGVGGSCRLVEQDGKPIETFHYMGWLVTSVWTDMAKEVSGDAYWYAALRRDAAHADYGTIVGFVQSRYLKLVR